MLTNMEYATELNDDEYKRLQQYAALQGLSVEEAASRLLALSRVQRPHRPRYTDNVIPFRLRPSQGHQ